MHEYFIPYIDPTGRSCWVFNPKPKKCCNKSNDYVDSHISEELEEKAEKEKVTNYCDIN
jgi:hypothetical protein